ncbi:sensor histidine kinase [Psychroserpens sp.]|jgi:K+-sensing histidine kinase KdpD|uniref:sensor histidine kinase n=1 Tax=Psychroserpens sp. TaxID=2020870 RepID=UPI0039E4AC72
MIEPDKYNNEKNRIEDLKSYSILDTLPEADYDNLTAIAAEICSTKISLISLIDNNRQWFKSRHGLNALETPRKYAFCAHAINDPDHMLIVKDASKDKRFHDNPLVIGGPKVIFYAGVPLMSDNGNPLGTLCVIDDKPKELSEGEKKSLNALAKQVVNVLNLRKTKLALERAINLEEKNQALERFAYVAAHDLKSPLINISMLFNLFIEDYGSKVDAEGLEMLNQIDVSANILSNLIEGLLEYSKSGHVLNENKTTINLKDLKADILGLLNTEHKLTLNLKSSIDEIVINKTALYQILINLVTNAIKYNDKKHIEIEIGVSASNNHYNFYVQDNGPGIPLEHQENIFNIFTTLTNSDRFGRSGSGIGLASVKKIVDLGGGVVKVYSELKKGAKFIFTLEK